MTTKNSVVSLTLTLKGNAGQELRKIGVDQINLTKKVNEQLNLGTVATGKQVQMGQRVTATLKEQVTQTSLLTKQLDSSQRNGQLLERFMTQSATQSKLLQSSIAKLGLDRPVRQSKELSENLQRAQKLISVVGSVGVGGAVIGRSLNNVERKAMGTDMAIRHANNTLQFGDGDTLKKQGRDILNTGLHEATVDGLALRQDVANLISKMAGQGIYDSPNKIDGAKRIATGSRDIVKTAIAGDADLDSVADLYKGIYQSAGVTDPKRARAMLDAVLRGGQLGSNELKDMAPGAASIMTSMANAGYSGETLVKEFVAQAQVAKLTDSDSAKANTNMQQAYKDLNSQFLQHTFAKNIPLAAGLPTKKDGHGKDKFDWQGFAYERKRDRGQSMVESAAELIDMQMQADPRYREIKGKLSKLDPSDRKNSPAINTGLEEMSKMVQGSVVGSDFHNLETNKFMLAMLLGKNQHKKYMDQLNQSEGAVDEAVGGLKDETAVKQQAAQNASDLASKVVADSMKGSVDKFYDGVTAFVNSHPIASATAGAGIDVAKGVASTGLSLWLAQKMGFFGGAAGGATGGAATGGLLRGAGGWLARGAGVIAGSEAALGAGFAAGGYGAGSLARWGYTKTKIGQDADNALGGSLALFASYFSNEAKDALAQNAKYNEMISQQEQQLAELKQLNAHLSKLPAISLDGRIVSEHVGSHTEKQSRRGAAVNTGASW